MDISEVAMEAAALLGGFGAAIGKDVADKAREAVAQRLYEVIEQRLGRRSSDARALANLVEQPADLRHHEVVAAALDDAVREDPLFAAQLRQVVAEARVFNSHNMAIHNSQTTTNTAPITGGQVITNVAPGAWMNDAIVNNQGTIDQSTATITTHDRRRTTHKKGIGGPWLVVIAVVFGLVVSGLTAYVIASINHPAWFDELFGPSPDNSRPASQTGGGKTTDNRVLPTNPYEAVRQVYQQVAQNNGSDQTDEVCLLFTEEAAEEFAHNLDYPDCQSAVRGLFEEVTDRNAYATSMPRNRAAPPGDTVRISSCTDNIRDGIQGGRPLGAFTVEKIEDSVGGQWIITGHEPEHCPG